MISVRYIFHDCFLVISDSASIVFDYWKDPRGSGESDPAFLDLIPADRPLYVAVSHHHKDHLNTDIFKWRQRFPDIRYILSKDTARFCRHFLREDSLWKGPKVPHEKVTVMRDGESFCDAIVRIRAFGSTDIGCSYAVTVDDRVFFHAGDLNAWIWKDESSESEVADALRQFTEILDVVAMEYPHIDYAMFPVDSRIGTDYFTGASLFVRAVDVDCFFPMHFELADTPEELAKRHDDAIAFDRFARPGYGEYVALLSPGALYVRTDR